MTIHGQQLCFRHYIEPLFQTKNYLSHFRQFIDSLQTRKIHYLGNAYTVDNIRQDCKFFRLHGDVDEGHKHLSDLP